MSELGLYPLHQLLPVPSEFSCLSSAGMGDLGSYERGNAMKVIVITTPENEVCEAVLVPSNQSPASAFKAWSQSVELDEEVAAQCGWQLITVKEFPCPPRG